MAFCRGGGGGAVSGPEVKDTVRSAAGAAIDAGVVHRAAAERSAVAGVEKPGDAEVHAERRMMGALAFLLQAINGGKSE